MDADATVAAPSVAAGREHRRRQLLLVVAAAEPLGHLLGDAAGRHVVLADRRQEHVEVVVAELVDHVLELRRVPHPLHRQALAAELVGQVVTPGLDHVERAARG